MEDRPVSIEDVVAWVREVLTEYQGLYEVQDLTFVRSALRVVTVRRDARFDVARSRWGELRDPEARLALTAELQRWARQNLAAARQG